MTLKNNLPPESQPWGRDIEKRLSDLEFGNSVALNRNANTNDGVLATLRQLSDQITTLATQQTIITSLLSDQVKFGRAGNGTSNFSVPTSDVAIFSQTITVPAGYSQAIVLAIANASIFSSTNASGVYLKATIDEVHTILATTMPIGPLANLPQITLSSAATRLRTGLSGGTITVNACMRSTVTIPSNSNTAVTLDGLAIFLK